MKVLDMQTYSNSVSETVIHFKEQNRRSILRAKKGIVTITSPPKISHLGSDIFISFYKKIKDVISQEARPRKQT